MSTVVVFPGARIVPGNRGFVEKARTVKELAGPKVVILPVVRIERHADAPPVPARGGDVGPPGASRRPH